MSYKVPSHQLLTIEEYESLPNEDPYTDELVRGVVVREPPPGGEHGVLIVEIVRRLSNYVTEYQLGRVLTHSGFVLATNPATVRSPDIAFISNDRFPLQIPLSFWQFAPDLAVEVVSPSNSESEMQEMVADYLAAGSRMVWLIYPRTQTATVFRPNTDIRLLQQRDSLDGGDVVPGFVLPLNELFAALKKH